ncbi:MAG: GGDEF domain-containing protein [Pseudohongiella sp.]|nr:GGDEF domain-containing protein [Pseudohongiella sp.]MDP2127118.1 GGDEF domain-containing protein [Pseudohongiella sp.]
MMHNISDLPALVLSSLEEQIAVIDLSGTIVYVNNAWIKFGAENDLTPDHYDAGSNYLTVLVSSAASGDRIAGEAEEGLRNIISNKQDSFHIEYPCHSPSEQRWFMMSVLRLKDDSSKRILISHTNITRRKLAEEQIKLLAMQDPLTGLSNRRQFNQTLSREIRRSIRNQTPVSLIEFDIDYFKNYNDEWGHIAGDECLIKVATVLQELAHRSGDLAMRLGGDEFALLLADTDCAGSQKVAESVLKAISDLGLTFGGSRHLTVSAGVACVTYSAQMDEDFLLQQADKALYRAKQAGRNRVVPAPSPPLNKLHTG